MVKSQYEFNWNIKYLLGKHIINVLTIVDLDLSDSDVDEIDIDNMLDEGLPDSLREAKKMHYYEEKSKMVLEGKRSDNIMSLEL